MKRKQYLKYDEQVTFAQCLDQILIIKIIAIVNFGLKTSDCIEITTPIEFICPSLQLQLSQFGIHW